MQWKISLLFGVFIVFEHCFPSVTAAITVCEDLDDQLQADVETFINDFRTKYDGVSGIKLEKGNPAEAGSDGNALQELLIGANDPANDATSPDALSYHNPAVAKTKTALTGIIDEWIKSGDKYDPTNPDSLTPDMYNFARLLWKGSTKAVCVVCVAPTPADNADQGFGCRFSPAAQLSDKTEISNNLPAQTGGDGGSVNGTSDGAGGGSQDKFSEFEKTVRTFTLISSIATIIVVVLGFVIALLVAIKIFLL